MTQQRRAKPGEAIAFLRETVASPPSGCVLWQFARTGLGYGNIMYEDKNWPAHALALALYSGGRPEGMYSLHEPGIGCQRLCINPTHLRWGTQQDNMLDRRIDGTVRYGIITGPRPELRGSKLPPDVYESIKSAEGSNRQIADRFGSNRETVRNIRNGTLEPPKA